MDKKHMISSFFPGWLTCPPMKTFWTRYGDPRSRNNIYLRTESLGTQAERFKDWIVFKDGSRLKLSEIVAIEVHKPKNSDIESALVYLSTGHKIELKELKL